MRRSLAPRRQPGPACRAAGGRHGRPAFAATLVTAPVAAEVVDVVVSDAELTAPPTACEVDGSDAAGCGCGAGAGAGFGCGAGDSVTGAGSGADAVGFGCGAGDSVAGAGSGAD